MVVPFMSKFRSQISHVMEPKLAQHYSLTSKMSFYLKAQHYSLCFTGQHKNRNSKIIRKIPFYDWLVIKDSESTHDNKHMLLSWHAE